jgi:hypothetical protein
MGVPTTTMETCDAVSHAAVLPGLPASAAPAADPSQPGSLLRSSSRPAGVATTPAATPAALPAAAMAPTSQRLGSGPLLLLQGHTGRSHTPNQPRAPSLRSSGTPAAQELPSSLRRRLNDGSVLRRWRYAAIEEPVDVPRVPLAGSQRMDSKEAVGLPVTATQAVPGPLEAARSLLPTAACAGPVAATGTEAAAAAPLAALGPLRRRQRTAIDLFGAGAAGCALPARSPCACRTAQIALHRSHCADRTAQIWHSSRMSPPAAASHEPLRPAPRAASSPAPCTQRMRQPMRPHACLRPRRPPNPRRGGPGRARGSQPTGRRPLHLLLAV